MGFSKDFPTLWEGSTTTPSLGNRTWLSYRIPGYWPGQPMMPTPFPKDKESYRFGRLREALGAGLGGHSSLRVLWLYGNRIGDSGLQALGGGKGSESAGPEDILDIRLRDGKLQVSRPKVHFCVCAGHRRGPGRPQGPTRTKPGQQRLRRCGDAGLELIKLGFVRCRCTACSVLSAYKKHFKRSRASDCDESKSGTWPSQLPRPVWRKFSLSLGLALPKLPCVWRPWETH